MRTFHRYCDETQKDYQKMWRFLVNDYKDKENHFSWSLGRLGEWKYHMNQKNRSTPDFIRNNSQLWFDDNDVLISFVISESGDEDFFIFAKRGYEFLYREMLEWVKNNWLERKGILTIEIDEVQIQLARVLETEGYVNKGITAVTRQYDLQANEYAKSESHNGFIINDMFTKPNITGSILLGLNAWHLYQGDISDHDLRSFQYRRENPSYFPHLDIYAEDGNGMLVSGCNAFVDYENSYAVIERVCTHINYRRRGFSQAIITECQRRLKMEGIKYSYITGYSDDARSLYGKFNSANHRNLIEYSLGKNI